MRIWRRNTSARNAIAAGLAGLAVITGFNGAAEARWGGRHAADVERGYVIAKSRFGNGSVSGPVRNTSLGAQVRTPSGIWEYCRRSCSETLRVETIDFWEGRQDGQVGLMQEKGVFGWLDLGF